jgi:hypothetical protein
MGFSEDLLPGEKLLDCFRPFLHHLIHLQLSRKTICKHVDNLCVLGGEIIRDLHETPSRRRVPISQVLFVAVQNGGLLPYGWGDSEDQLRSFESTCRKFCRFLQLQSAD